MLFKEDEGEIEVVMAKTEAKVEDKMDPGIVRWPVFIYCVMGAIYGSDVHIRYGINTTLFFNVMVCDLYFDSHILLCLCITLILILYGISIKCVYVREYY